MKEYRFQEGIMPDRVQEEINRWTNNNDICWDLFQVMPIQRGTTITYTLIFSREATLND